MNPLITPRVAEEITLSTIPELAEEDVPPEQARGRILALPLVADRPLPPYDRVMMDGICCKKSDLEEHTTLAIAGDHPAGAPTPQQTPRGHCWEVMTGACLPPDCDTVIPYEQISRQDHHFTIEAGSAVAGRFIHRRASDYETGEILVPPNTIIDSRVAAVAATVGATTLRVLQRPRVSLFTTGDEVVDRSSTPADHEIRQSNAAALHAALSAVGAELAHYQHLPDDPGATLTAVEKHRNCDLLILCGGISKGKYDFVRPVMEKIFGPPSFHGVAQRPGKPLAFWGGTPSIFALPGNPMSVQITFHRYVLPFLKAAQRQRYSSQIVSLSSNFSFEPAFAYSLPVKTSQEEACTIAEPLPLANSGDFASAIESDGFIELPAEKGSFPKGTLASYWPWL